MIRELRRRVKQGLDLKLNSLWPLWHSHNPRCLISLAEVVVVSSSVLSVNDGLQPEQRISKYGDQMSSKSGPRLWTTSLE